MENNYYPVLLQLHNKRCLVVGGGDVAARKVASLLECGAAVSIVSPDIVPALEELLQAGRVDVTRHPYQVDDIKDAFLVIAATNSAAVNREVASDCQKRHILVNVVDAPDRGDFIVPATIRRGPLTIAVSTGGMMPAQARKIRRTLESQFDASYGQMLECLGHARQDVLRDVTDANRRKRIFTALAAEDLLSVVRSGGNAAINSRIQEIITETE